MNRDYCIAFEVRRNGIGRVGEMPFPLYRIARMDVPPQGLPDLVDQFLEHLRRPEVQKDMAVMLANYAKAESNAELWDMESKRLEEKR